MLQARGRDRRDAPRPAFEGSSGSGGRLPSVLIVEDEPSVRRLLRIAFEAAGYRVFEAPDGQQAVLLAVTAHPDLMVLDVMLPQMDGNEVLRRIRSTSPTRNLPVLVVTASDYWEDTLRWQVGTGNVMMKPFDPDEVVARADGLLGRPPGAQAPAEPHPGTQDWMDDILGSEE